MVKKLFCKLFGDKGYPSQPLFKQLLETFHIQYITKQAQNTDFSRCFARMTEVNSRFRDVLILNNTQDCVVLRTLITELPQTDDAVPIRGLLTHIAQTEPASAENIAFVLS